MGLRALGIFAVGPLVTSCLFPSFDSLGRTGPDDPPPVDPGTGAISAISAVDASAPLEAASRPAVVVACGGDTCGAGSFCCTNPITYHNTCQPQGSDTSCATRIGCDDQSDCPGEQVCCGKGRESTCGTTCDGLVVCSILDPRCPAGKTCTGEQNHAGILLRYCR